MIKLTLFSQVKSKDKSFLAAKGELVTVNSFKEAINVITNNATSPCIYKDNKRSKKNFLSTKLLMFDIDEGLSLNKAIEILDQTEYKYAIYTTVSHQKDKNGKICDRFRIVLETDIEINNENNYKETINQLKFLKPYVDKSCLETARYFLGNPNSKIFIKEGKFVPTIKKATHPNVIKELNVGKDVKNTLNDFFKNAHTGFPGNWNFKLNKVCYTLARAGIPQMQVIEMIQEVAPQKLDDADLKTIQSGYSSGQKAGPYVVLEDTDNMIDKIEKFIKDLKIQKTPKGLFLKEEKFELDELANYIYCEMSRVFKKVSPLSINIVLKNWYRTIKDDNTFEREYFKHLKHNSNLKGMEIKKVVNAISANNHDLNEVALRHWIWQLKRKIFGKPVEHHLMIVLFGKSGSGKTVFLNKFVEPLKPFVLPADVSIVNDNREFHNFAENFVVFFDEMAHAARADVNKLKNIITCDTVSYRILGKNSNIEHKNNASFIGASNTEIVELIKDPTSARRYFQLNTLDKLDWNTVNSLNVVKLYQEVDEEGEAPIKAYLKEIAKFQDTEIRSRDSIEEWLEVEEIEFCQNKEDEGREVSPNDLYEMYAQDQISQGKRLYHRKSFFFKRLKEFAPQFRVSDKRFYKIKWKKASTQPYLNVIEFTNTDKKEGVQ